MLLWQLTILSGVASAALTCYDSGRNPIDPSQGNIVPCQPDAEVSACCREGFICLSNGLCQWTSESATYYNTSYFTPYYYQGCTDQTLQASVCNVIDTCSNENVPGDGLESCGGQSYCCYGYGGCNCSVPQSTFIVQGGTVVTTLPLPSASTSSTTTTTASSTITTAATTTSSPTATGTTSPEKSGGSSSNTTAIGAGVGVGVGVLILAIAGAWWFFRRRYKNKEKTLATPNNNNNNNNHNYHNPAVPPYSAHAPPMNAGEKPQYGDTYNGYYMNQQQQPNAYVNKPLHHQSVSEAPSSPPLPPHSAHRYGPVELGS